MRKLLILSFCVLLLNGAYGQTEGTVRYLCTSNWSKMLAKVDYISKQRREKNEYVWGSRAEWKTYNLLHYSPAASKYEESDEVAETRDMGWSNRKTTYFFYSDLVDNHMHNAMTLLGKPYIVNDTLFIQSWKIKNDMKEICGHICMNAQATDTLRKQNIEAWFALDIPVNTGPERFKGLPGLILEVNINEGAYIMSADKIEPKKLGKELETPTKLRGKKINQAEYDNIFAKKIKESIKEEEPWFWWLPY